MESVKILEQQDVERIVDERLSHLKGAGPQSPWLTEKELAVYLRLFDGEGNPQVAGIKKWTTRAENPLPCGMAGERSRRYHRERVDEWLVAEAARVRAQKAEGEGESAQGLRRVK